MGRKSARKSAPCTAAIVAALLLLASGAAEADGRKGGFHGQRHGFPGGHGLPSIRPGHGTYAGASAALHVRGLGTYVAAEGIDAGIGVITAPGPRIIDARKGPPCSWESGVCVIRPQ